jgi:hypothetical protein
VNSLGVSIGLAVTALIGFLRDNWPLGIVAGFAVWVLLPIGLSKRVGFRSSRTRRAHRLRVSRPESVGLSTERREAIETVYRRYGEPAILQAEQLVTSRILGAVRHKGHMYLAAAVRELQNDVVNGARRAGNELVKVLPDKTIDTNELEGKLGDFFVRYNRLVNWIHALADTVNLSTDDEQYLRFLNADRELQGAILEYLESQEDNRIEGPIMRSLRGEFSVSHVLRVDHLKERITE